MNPNIKELYAWVVDDPTGRNGIAAFTSPTGIPIQAVTSKRHLADKLKPIVAKEMAALGAGGKTVHLIKFTGMEVVDEVQVEQ